MVDIRMNCDYILHNMCFMGTHMHACMYTRMHVHTYTHTHIHTHTHTYTHTHTTYVADHNIPELMAS